VILHITLNCSGIADVLFQQSGSLHRHARLGEVVASEVDVHREAAIDDDIAPADTGIGIDRFFPFYISGNRSDMIGMYVDFTELIRITQTGGQLTIQLIEVGSADLNIETPEKSATLCKRGPAKSKRYIARLGFDITARRVIVVRAGNVCIERHVTGTDTQTKLGPEWLIEM